MKKLKISLLLAALGIAVGYCIISSVSQKSASPASVAKAGSSPLCFDKISKDRYILVVLGANGKAKFLERETRSDGTVWFFHDDAATWGYFPNKNAYPNIWVSTRHFRFDYFLEGKRLTEIDKMGIQNVLTKRENS